MSDKLFNCALCPKKYTTRLAYEFHRAKHAKEGSSGDVTASETDETDDQYFETTVIIQFVKWFRKQ